MRYKNLFLNIGITLSLIATSIYIYDIYKKSNQKEKIYYVVNVEKLYSQKKDELEKLIKNGAKEEEIENYKSKYIIYIQKTEKYLSKLSEKNNIVIFNKKAIFSNTRTIDLTERIIDATK